MSTDKSPSETLKAVTSVNERTSLTHQQQASRGIFDEEREHTGVVSIVGHLGVSDDDGGVAVFQVIWKI